MRISVFAALVVFAACAPSAPRVPPESHRCPEEMAHVARSAQVNHEYCIDRYEASLVEVGETGDKPFSPFEAIGARTVRAVSRPGVFPQAHLSRNEADAACKRSHKRLCTETEWVFACNGGKTDQTYPYGAKREAGACNDHGKSPLVRVASNTTDEWERMNDPRLNQQPNTLSKTGEHHACKSPVGVFDMVGNLHEWVDDREGTFLGGYYLDTTLNGPGCRYKTVAHGPTYRDYSTGFRCCADVR